MTHKFWFQSSSNSNSRRRNRGLGCLQCTLNISRSTSRHLFNKYLFNQYICRISFSHGAGCLFSSIYCEPEIGVAANSKKARGGGGSTRSGGTYPPTPLSAFHVHGNNHIYFDSSRLLCSILKPVSKKAEGGGGLTQSGGGTYSLHHHYIAAFHMCMTYV